jgi:hypothetical protein
MTRTRTRLGVTPHADDPDHAVAPHEPVVAADVRRHGGEVARRNLQPAQRAVAVAGPLTNFEFELSRWYDGHIDIFVPKRLLHHFD